MPYKTFSFGKSERLCSKKLIEELFNNTQSNRISEHPFLLMWNEAKIETEYPAQVLIVVSKKLFPKAVDRNRIRRQIRELYRLNKHLVYEPLERNHKKIAIIILYRDQTIPEKTYLTTQYQKLIEKFVNHIGQAV
jgi:ribonuclease P protein component